MGGGGGQGKRETESELRLEEIHHGVRRTDTPQPQIHHCSHVWRRNWTQETSELEMRSGARGQVEGERRGEAGGRQMATDAGRNLSKSSC